MPDQRQDEQSEGNSGHRCEGLPTTPCHRVRHKPAFNSTDRSTCQVPLTCCALLLYPSRTGPLQSQPLGSPIFIVDDRPTTWHFPPWSPDLWAYGPWPIPRSPAQAEGRHGGTNHAIRIRPDLSTLQFSGLSMRQTGPFGRTQQHHRRCAPQGTHEPFTTEVPQSHTELLLRERTSYGNLIKWQPHAATVSD